MAGGIRASIRRIAIALGAIAILLVAFYFWQPMRFDLIERLPQKPLARIPIDRLGLFQANKRVLIVTAHPDDEVYYIAGLLVRLRESGAIVKLVALTNGDKCYYPLNDSESLAKARQSELRSVAARVKIQHVVFFNMPDGRLEDDDRIVERLRSEFVAFQPDVLFLFDPDYPPRMSHRDHRTAGEIALRTAKRANFKGWLAMFSTAAPNTALDVTKQWPEVDELIALHASQFSGEKLVRIRNSVGAFAMEAGEKFDMAYAEPFRAFRL